MTITSQDTTITEMPMPKHIENNSAPIQIAIIGGGLTGLITAHLLEQSFTQVDQTIQITVFEKSAGVGRLATRYKKLDMNKAEGTQQWQFDFGAQFFTAKSDAFKSYLKPWLDDGLIEPWLAKTAEVSTLDIAHLKPTGQWHIDQPRYISSPKMTSFGRDIASQLKHTTIHYKTRVAPLSDLMTQKLMTSLEDEDGNKLGDYDWVICTAPQGQALEMVANTSFEPIEALNQLKMLACYTLMLGWSDKANMPHTLKQAQWDVLDVTDASFALGRVFVEHHKPSRTDILPSVTIHANNEWSEQHVDEDIEQVKQRLLDEAKPLFGWDDSSAPEHIDCHRWRYAATKPQQTNAELVYYDEKKQWIVTGDWCDEGRIESCFKAASRVVDLIKGD